MQAKILTLTLLLGGMAAAQAPEPQIPWRHSLASALTEAKEKNKAILVCINMDKERANDEMARNHYHDRAVVDKAAEFICVIASKYEHAEERPDAVCPRFGAVTCAEHMAVERAVREAYLGSNTVNSPQHLFIKPDGTLHSTKLWFMSKPELIELLDSALRGLFPERFKPVEAPEPELPPATPAAAGAAGAAPEAGLKKDPKTPEEVRAAVLETGDKYEIRDYARRVVKSEKPEDRALVAAWLADPAFKDKRLGLLLALGFRGNKEGVSVLLPLLTSKVKDERQHAAVALEDIGDKTALKVLKKQLDVEEDRDVRKDLARALGTCAEGEAASAELLMKLTNDKEGIVARNATLALGHFKKNEKVEKHLFQAAFLSGGGGGRGGGRGGFGAGFQKIEAAGYALAMLQSKKAREEARKRAENESNERMQGLLDGFLRLLETDIDPANPDLARQRARIGGDRIRRDRDPELGDGGRGMFGGPGGEGDD